MVSFFYILSAFLLSNSMLSSNQLAFDFYVKLILIKHLLKSSIVPGTQDFNKSPLVGTNTHHGVMALLSKKLGKWSHHSYDHILKFTTQFTL